MPSSLESSKEFKVFIPVTLTVRPIDLKIRGLKRRNLEHQNQPLDCTHQFSSGGLCFVCGRRQTTLPAAALSPEEEKEKEKEEDKRVPFKYVLDDFSLSKSEIVAFRSINTEINLLEKKKLFLVLDLDNTLLHSVSLRDFKIEDLAHFYDLAKEEGTSSSMTHVREFKSIHKKNIFFIPKMKKLVKLRPFAIKFLKKASKMFELYVYTKGSRGYANIMANLLDPDEKHFDWRVISREDSLIGGCEEKSLEIVFGEESKVVIVDDKKSVWGKDGDNVIPIQPYFFWEKDSRIARNWKEMKMKMEMDKINGGDKELEFMLKTLKKLHCLFFDDESSSTGLMNKDVRLMMTTARKEYLNRDGDRICVASSMQSQL